MDVVNIGAVSFPAAVDRGHPAGLARGRGLRRRSCAEPGSDVARQVASAGRALRAAAAGAGALVLGADGRLPGERAGPSTRAALPQPRHPRRRRRERRRRAGGRAAARLRASGQYAPDELLARARRGLRGVRGAARALLDERPRLATNERASTCSCVSLYDWLADACDADADNGRGGRMRPGTGSAMYYVWLARGGPGDAAAGWSGATADGRQPRRPLRRQPGAHAARRVARSDQRAAVLSPRSTTGASATAGPSRWSSPTRSSETTESIAKVRHAGAHLRAARLPAACSSTR